MLYSGSQTFEAVLPTLHKSRFQFFMLQLPTSLEKMTKNVDYLIQYPKNLSGVKSNRETW